MQCHFCISQPSAVDMLFVICNKQIFCVDITKYHDDVEHFQAMNSLALRYIHMLPSASTHPNYYVLL